MPTNNRSFFRDIHIYNGISGELIGELKQNGSVTETVLFYMLDILLVTDASLEVKHNEVQEALFHHQATPWSVVYMMYIATVNPLGHSLRNGQFD